MDKTMDQTVVTEATKNLAANLAACEPFLRYKAAEEKMNGDEQAQRLLKELADLQQEIRTAQYSGIVTDEDLQRLKELQSQMGENEIIQAYAIAQEKAVSFLREVNQEISSLIGIDFSSLTRRSGCC